MNYLFFNIGKIPNYLIHSIYSVKQRDKNSNIFLLSDSKFDNNDVNHIDINKVNDKRINFIKSLNYFDNWSSNLLWEASLLRIFYLYEFAKYLKIKSFVHFDNDVVLYKSFEEVENLNDRNRFNITPLTNNFLVFGYSFIENLELYDDICEKILKIYQNSSSYENEYYNGKKIIEMKALYIVYNENPDLFNLLPIHPKQNSKYIFDPASYGQFLSGTHNKKLSKKFTDIEHILGPDLRTKNLKPKYKNSNASVDFEGRNIELVNLHIHSKKLSKYI